jgi:hypothetical protein
MKEGNRHMYSRRTLYIDEDNWTAIASEMYDGRGKLWRVQYAYIADLYDRKTAFSLAYGSYDIAQDVYNLSGKPVPGTYSNNVDLPGKYFSADGMARGGVR